MKFTNADKARLLKAMEPFEMVSFQVSSEKKPESFDAKALMERLEGFEEAARLALPVANDYERAIDDHHDGTCGDHPTCGHTAKWDRARALKEKLKSLGIE